MPKEAQLESLVLDASQVKLPNGLVLDKFALDLPSASAQLKPFSLTLSAPAKFEATVSQTSVARFLNGQGIGGLKDFTAKVDDGVVVVEATARVIVELRVAVTCTLRIVDEDKLYIDLQSVSVPGPVARGIVEKELAKANPVLDLAVIAPTVKMRSVTAANGEILVQGTADWPTI